MLSARPTPSDDAWCSTPAPRGIWCGFPYDEKTSTLTAHATVLFVFRDPSQRIWKRSQQGLCSLAANRRLRANIISTPRSSSVQSSLGSWKQRRKTAYGCVGIMVIAGEHHRRAHQREPPYRTASTRYILQSVVLWKLWRRDGTIKGICIIHVRGLGGKRRGPNLGNCPQSRIARQPVSTFPRPESRMQSVVHG